MHVRTSLRATVVAMLAILLMSGSLAMVQVQVDSGTRAALAAMTLTGDELPSTYTLRGEAFVGPEGGDVTGEVPAAFTDAGFRAAYMSVYEAEDGSGTITSYASAWTDAAAAETGFGLLENVDGETDEPLEAGNGPAELTVTDDGFDATFVVDRFVAGVSASGGEVAQEDIDALVTSLDSRATSVAGGQFPVGTDPSLPGMVLGTGALGAEVRAGYLSASESEELYGLTGSSLGGMLASWVSLAATGADAAPPYVTIAVSTFELPDNAARVVEQAEQLVPLTVGLQPIYGVAVEGADSARAFQYSGPGSESPDSVRIVAQVGVQVAVVDVEGAASVEEAQAAAGQLANAQVACMGGTCELPDVSLGEQ